MNYKFLNQLTKMKKIIFGLAIFASLQIFAQEAEVKKAMEFVESENFSSAKASIESVQSVFDAKLNAVDPKVVAEYYFVKGSVAMNEKNLKQAGEFFAKLKDIETKPYFVTKEKDTKEKFYFYDKEEADKFVASGNYTPVKSEKVASSLSNDVSKTVSERYQFAFASAQSAINDKNYQSAADNFSSSYFLGKALGIEEPRLYYYAALSYLNAQMFNDANTIFDFLIKSKFTGVSEITEAVKLSNTEERVKINKDNEILFKNNKDYRIETTKTPSLETEMYKNAIISYEAAKEIDKAIATAKSILSKNPSDVSLNEILADIYIRSERKQEYLDFANSLIQVNPNNDLYYYNLGVIYANMDKDAEAKQNYEKAISINPKSYNTYFNLAVLILKKEKRINEDIKKLGTTKADFAKEDALVKEKKQVLRDALPYLEKAYEIDNTQKSVISTLKNIYRVLGETAKYEQIKDK